MIQIQGQEAILQNFPTEVSQCEEELANTIEEHLTMHQIRSFLPALLSVLYPIGTVLFIEGEEKPIWMNNDWEPVEKGRVVVSSDPLGGTFATGMIGGSADHSHGTQPHILTIQEIPSHTHQVRGMSGSHYFCRTISSDYSSGEGPSYINSYSAGGGTAHDHGLTEIASSYPPYICVTFWKRIR
jgi:hypothetical protein